MRNLLLMLCCFASLSVALQQERDYRTAPRRHTYPARVAANVDDPRASAPYSWIAASEVLDENENLREDLIFGVGAPWERRRGRLAAAFAEAKLAAAEGTEPPPCYVMNLGQPFSVASRPEPRNLDELAAIAEFAFTGVVTASEPGFDSQSHGVTVLTIGVRSWLLESPHYSPGATMFVLYPAANFYLGPLEICSSQNGFPEVPNLGDIVTITQPNTFDWQARAGASDASPFVTFAYGFYARPNGPLQFTDASRRFSILANAPSVDIATERLRARIQARRK